ncbi:hypothetical protein ACHAQH_000306 [Verticillium albo-atrum]
MASPLKTITVQSKTINIPIARVWAIVAAWGCESLWMPDCTSSSLEGFGIGSVRVLEFGEFPGVGIRETLKAVDPSSHSLSFRIYRDDYPDMENHAELKLRAVSETETEVQWTGQSTMTGEDMIKTLKARLDALYLGFTDSLYNHLK